MGFLDIFKKLAGHKEKEPEIEKIKFNEVSSLISSKKKLVEKQNQELLDLIKQEISQTVSELDEKIPILESVDLEKIKEQARIKIIVKENLVKYIGDVQGFKNNLADLQENSKNTGELISAIDNLVEDFQKRSSMSFQKATILVGKELGAIRDSMKTFLANTRKVINENKDSLDKIKAINSIEKSLGEKDRLEKQKSDLASNISEQNTEIEKIKKEILVIEKNLESVRSSEQYLEIIRKKKEFEDSKERLNKEIHNLEKLVDFKGLANFFHTNHKEMEIMKAHKDYFKENFEKDSGERILKLLEESKQANQGIKDKISEIIILKKDIENSKPVSSDHNGAAILEREIKAKQDKIEHLNIEKIKETKRNEKLDSNIANIFYSIKDSLTEMNVEIIVDV